MEKTLLTFFFLLLNLLLPSSLMDRTNFLHHHTPLLHIFTTQTLPLFGLPLSTTRRRHRIITSVITPDPFIASQIRFVNPYENPSPFHDPLVVCRASILQPPPSLPSCRTTSLKRGIKSAGSAFYLFYFPDTNRRQFSSTPVLSPSHL